MPDSDRDHSTFVQLGGWVAVIGPAGRSDLLALPPLEDCTVDQLRDVLHRLPDGMGLLIEPGATHARVFDTQNYPKSQGRQRSIGDRLASQGEADQTR